MSVLRMLSKVSCRAGRNHLTRLVKVLWPLTERSSTLLSATSIQASTLQRTWPEQKTWLRPWKCSHPIGAINLIRSPLKPKRCALSRHRWQLMLLSPWNLALRNLKRRANSRTRVSAIWGNSNAPASAYRQPTQREHLVAIAQRMPAHVERLSWSADQIKAERQRALRETLSFEALYPASAPASRLERLRGHELNIGTAAYGNRCQVETF